MILPPAGGECKQLQKLDSFFQKDKSSCKDNPQCKCGRYNWCAGYQVTTPDDWRFESLTVSEQVAVEYRYLLRKDRQTIRPFVSRIPTPTDKRSF